MAVEVPFLAATPTDYTAILAADQATLNAIPAAVLLASIVESSSDAIITIDLSGNITSWNRGASQLYGYAPEEIVGRPTSVLIPDEKHSDESQVLDTALRGETLDHYETVRLHKDGTRVDISLSVSPVWDAEGRIVGAAKIARDITQRKSNERALARQAEEQTALYQFVDRVRRCRDVAEACEAAVDAITRALRCDRASVLLSDNDGVMRFVAWHGLSDTYRAAVDGHSPWPHDAADAQPIYVSDLAAADLPEALRSTIVAEGIQALAFVPLYADDRLVGKFMTYYSHPHLFTDEENAIGVAISRQLGLSVDRIRTAEVRNAAMAELQASEERYRAVVESQADAICRFRLDGEILFANDAYARLLGLDADTLAGSNFWDFVAESDRANVRAQLEELSPRKTELQIENRFESIRGPCWMLWTNRALSFDANGAVLEAQSTGIDITDRKLAEEALKESQQRLQLALSAGNMGAWEWELRSSKVSWTPNVEKIHGLLPGEFGGTIEDFKRHIHREDVDRVLAHIQRAISGAEDYHVAYRIRTPAGEIRWIDAYGKVMFAPDGTVDKMTGVCMDITARKNAEEERELLLAELNHRVKNTLATVVSIAQLSFKNAASPQEAQRALDARIRSLAQVHGRLSESSWFGLSLEGIIVDELAPYRRSDGRNMRISGAPLTLEPKAGLQLGMAMHELATNAAKYGALKDSDGVVSVNWECSVDGKYLKIVWREYVPSGVAPPTRSGFGRLFLERALASNLGGTVQTDIAASGLTCIITLPAAKVISDHPSRISDQDASLSRYALFERTKRPRTNGDGAPLRVLVIEDEPLLGVIMEQELEENGFSVVGPFGDLTSAINATRREEFGVALLDINLNGDLSYPIADELMSRGVPFVLVSGYGFSDLPARFRTLPRVSKPYEPRRLLEQINILAQEMRG